MGLPWLGFVFGLVVAKLLRQSEADVRAIAIETGIQNTGVSIFLLRFTLEPPAADLTTGECARNCRFDRLVRLYLYIISLPFLFSGTRVFRDNDADTVNDSIYNKIDLPIQTESAGENDVRTRPVVREAPSYYGHFDHFAVKRV